MTATCVRTATGPTPDLGGAKWRCCWADWGCQTCNASNCVVECKTRRCCELNEVSSDEHCFVFLEGADDGAPDSDGPLGGVVNADLETLAEAEVLDEGVDDSDESPSHMTRGLELQVDLLLVAAATEDDGESAETVRQVQLCGAGMLFPMMLGMMGCSLLAGRRRSKPGASD